MLPSENQAQVLSELVVVGRWERWRCGMDSSVTDGFIFNCIGLSPRDSEADSGDIAGRMRHFGN